MRLYRGTIACFLLFSSPIHGIGAEHVIARQRAPQESQYERVQESRRATLLRYERDLTDALAETIQDSGIIPSADDRTVYLGIRINDRGVPIGVFVIHSSGYEDLDREAIGAFHRASPLPVAPASLQGKPFMASVNVRLNTGR